MGVSPNTERARTLCEVLRALTVAMADRICFGGETA